MFQFRLSPLLSVSRRALRSLGVAGSLGLALSPAFAQAPKKNEAAGQPPGQRARAALAAIAAPTDPSALQVPPGFKVELLYTVPKEEQGSWVALAVDPKGRLTAGDQYGGLYRITVPPIGISTGARIEKLAITLPAVTPPPGTESRPTPKRAQATDGSESPSVGAHGLLYAFGSLYVMVGEIPAKHGLWRFRDTDGDDQFDEYTYLREMRGGGEHGPHGLALSPDGKSIYFANGNYSELPARLDLSRPVRWDEDHLLEGNRIFRGIGSGRGLLEGNRIFRGIGSGRGLRGGCRVETESDPGSPPTLKSA